MTSAGFGPAGSWSPISVWIRKSDSPGQGLHGSGGSPKQGASQARWALVEATHSVILQPGPLRALNRRIRARRGYQIATVAAARTLACVFWCLLARDENYADAQPSLTAMKLRKLELNGRPRLVVP